VTAITKTGRVTILISLCGLWCGCALMRARPAAKGIVVNAYDLDVADCIISTTDLVYHPQSGHVYGGIYNVSGDILYRFDPETKEFRFLGYNKLPGYEKHETKIHKSFAVDRDGSIFFATATVSADPDMPGGKLWRYVPKDGRFEFIAVPVPGTYVQTIQLDTKRRIVYGGCYPNTVMFRYDLRTSGCKTFDIALGHIPALDDDGNLWGVWRKGDAEDAPECLLKYDPDADTITKYDMPWGNDCSLNGGDGYIYGAANGTLRQLDPRTAEVSVLTDALRTDEGGRVQFAMGCRGVLYGVFGNSGMTRVFSYNTRSGELHDYGPCVDPGRYASCWIPHDACITRDGTLYIGSTDVPHRSAYLWEIQFVK